MKRLPWHWYVIVFLLALSFHGEVRSQNITCPTRPVGDDSNACASTAFVGNAIDAIGLFPTVAAAAAKDLSALETVITESLAAGRGAWGGARYAKVASEPLYCTAKFQDAGGNWWQYVPDSPNIFDVRVFGAQFDWAGTDGSATDDRVAIQRAINCAASSIAQFDTGGTEGAIVMLPKGTALVGSERIQVQDGVQVQGQGPYSTVLKMATAFPAAAHFVTLGNSTSVNSIALSQNRGSAGALLLNGDTVSGGVSYQLQPTLVSVASAGNDTGINFTINGTSGTGSVISDTFAGASGGTATGTVFFKTITSITVDGATAANVTVGRVVSASFSSRLQGLQLWSVNMNATSGHSMVWTENAQHNGGVSQIKIFAGNRHGVRIVTGVGGASYITLDDIEVFNHSDVSVTSVNSMIYLDYAGPLLTPLNRTVCAAPSSAQTTNICVQAVGGVININQLHVEGDVARGISVEIPSINSGTVTANGITGGAGVTDLVYIDVAVDIGSVILANLYPNGATNTINDQSRGVATGSQNLVAPWEWAIAAPDTLNGSIVIPTVNGVAGGIGVAGNGHFGARVTAAEVRATGGSAAVVNGMWAPTATSLAFASNSTAAFTLSSTQTATFNAYTGGIAWLTNAGLLSNTSITGLVLGAGTSAPSAYAGTSCTNQFVRSLNASGVATCASVATTDISGQIAVAQGGTGASTLSGIVFGNGTSAFTALDAGQIPGVSTNTAANAGVIGEYMENAPGSVALTTATATNGASLALTAGDWDVGCGCNMTSTGATITTDIWVSISATTTTMNNTPAENIRFRDAAGITDFVFSNTINGVRVLLNGTSTYYCTVQSSFTVSTADANCKMYARRRR